MNMDELRNQDVVPSAGISSFKQNRYGGQAKALFKKSGDPTLLTMGKPRPEKSFKLDPASFDLPAGGLAAAYHMDNPVQRRQQERTDPITHFAHEGVVFGRNDANRKVRSATKYAYHAGLQTWTWAQDPDVKQFWGVADAPRVLSQKYQQGANGKRYYNVCGVEDLLPAATKPLIKCELQPSDHVMDRNDRDILPYCVREKPHLVNRPLHNYWNSDDMYNALQQSRNAGTDFIHHLVNGRRLRRPAPESYVDNDFADSDEENSELFSRGTRSKSNRNLARASTPPPQQDGAIDQPLKQNSLRQLPNPTPDYNAERKSGPWMELDASFASSNREDRGRNLSMTPMMITPGAQSNRLTRSRSEPPELLKVEAEPTPSAATPRSDTSRSRASRGSWRDTLAMTPQMITRQPGRSSTPPPRPRASTPPPRSRISAPDSRSMSEVVIR